MIITGLLSVSLLASQDPVCTSVRYLEPEGNEYGIMVTIEAPGGMLQSWFRGHIEFTSSNRQEYMLDPVDYNSSSLPPVHLYLVDLHGKDQYNLALARKLGPDDGLPPFPDSVAPAPMNRTPAMDSTMQPANGQLIPVPFALRFETLSEGIIQEDSLPGRVLVIMLENLDRAGQSLLLDMKLNEDLMDTLYFDPLTNKLYNREKIPGSAQVAPPDQVSVPDQAAAKGNGQDSTALTTNSFRLFMDTIQFPALLVLRGEAPSISSLLDTLENMEPGRRPGTDSLRIHQGEKGAERALESIRGSTSERLSDRATLLFKPLEMKPVLDFKDTLQILFPRPDGPLVIPVQIPTGELCKGYANHVKLKVISLAESRHFMEALDTLWKHYAHLNHFAECESASKGLNAFAEDVFRQYCDMDITRDPDPESSYQILARVDANWQGNKGSVYQTRKKQVLRHLYRQFWSSNNGNKWSRIADIGGQIQLSTDQDRARYHYARYKTTSDPDRACEHLAKAFGFDKSFENEHRQCVERRIERALENGNHEDVYAIGSKEFRHIKDNPVLRYGYAAAALETGHKREAYQQYSWFERNWNQVKPEGLSYETCTRIIRELAFQTGDFRKAFPAYKMDFLNSDLPSDLFWALCAHRMIYLDMIADSYQKISKMTGKTGLLQSVSSYQPGYVTDVKLSPARPDRAIYAAAGGSYPLGAFDPGSGAGFLLQKLPDGSFLEIVTNNNIPVRGSGDLVNALSGKGYQKMLFNRLFDMEKEVSLEFFGTAFKILLGEILASRPAALDDFLESLLKTGDFLYFSYRNGGQDGSLGTCPAAGDYDPAYYAISEKVIGYEQSRVEFRGKVADEIAIPLKNGSKRVGHIRIGIKY